MVSDPLAVMLIGPFPEVVVILPVVVNAPVWLMTTWPPVSLIPVIVSKLALFVNRMSPLIVFVALNPVT